MTGIYILFGGMALFATAITGLDWLARRQRRSAAAPLFNGLAADQNRR